MELQHQLELLENRLKDQAKDQENQPSAADIEEAFALLRLKREAGLNFEFLSNWQQMEKVCLEFDIRTIGLFMNCGSNMHNVYRSWKKQQSCSIWNTKLVATAR